MSKSSVIEKEKKKDGESLKEVKCVYFFFSFVLSIAAS
jgi:hypothetical protein